MRYLIPSFHKKNTGFSPEFPNELILFPFFRSLMLSKSIRHIVPGDI